jgi:hypothetical protein
MVVLLMTGNQKELHENALTGLDVIRGDRHTHEYDTISQYVLIK